MATAEDIARLHPKSIKFSFWAWVKEQVEIRANNRSMQAHALWSIPNSLRQIAECARYDYRDNQKKLIVWDKTFVAKKE
jgi:hypothetical protein